MAYMGSERHAWCASFKVSSGIWGIAKIELLTSTSTCHADRYTMPRPKQASPYTRLVTILYCPS